MTGDPDSDSDDTGASVGHDLSAERTTAPMSDFGSREVLYGFAFLVVGLALAFVIPALVTTL